MGNSPKITKKGTSKSPVQPNKTPPKVSEPTPEKKDDSIKVEATTTTTTEPLAPPPRPVVTQAVSNTPDYFSIVHGNLSSETNPFEHSFAGGGGANGGGLQTPGGTKLPSVAALTSPAGLLGPSGSTPGFWGGLRSGPLSPAMLSGPQKDDYFSDGHHLRGGFPTPNESSMRSGLTPGGGGSMFPEPSPGTQAMFNSLASGGATPGTLDFQRAAVNAANANKRSLPLAQPNITSQPQESSNNNDVKPNINSQFDRHDAADAANGLFMLANAPPQQTNHYAVAPPMPVHAHPQANMQRGNHSNDTSPQMGHRNNGSISTNNSARGVSEASGYSDEQETTARPNTRGKGKRTNTGTNGRRKTDDNIAKAPASKKAKTNTGMSMAMEPEPQSEEELDMNKDEYNANGKKMTDEEKRKNFLERNRVAALKCRQRKKQWLANLQQKVEMFSSENDSLSGQISQLREEVVNLKTLLLAHKDCPVTQQQGLQGMGMQHIMDNGYGPPMGNPNQMNPYGMSIGQQVMAGPGMQQQRRYS